MSRKTRFVIPGVPQHVIQRDHNREPCFYSEEDYLRYLDTLYEAAAKNGVAIHAGVKTASKQHRLEYSRSSLMSL